MNEQEKSIETLDKYFSGWQNKELQEIKKIYRQLVLQYHPDKLTEVSSEQEKHDRIETFKRITDMYQYIQQKDTVLQELKNLKARMNTSNPTGRSDQAKTRTNTSNSTGRSDQAKTRTGGYTNTRIIYQYIFENFVQLQGQLKQIEIDLKNGSLDKDNISKKLSYSNMFLQKNKNNMNLFYSQFDISQRSTLRQLLNQAELSMKKINELKNSTAQHAFGKQTREFPKKPDEQKTKAQKDNEVAGKFKQIYDDFMKAETRLKTIEINLNNGSLDIKDIPQRLSDLSIFIDGVKTEKTGFSKKFNESQMKVLDQLSADIDNLTKKIRGFKKSEPKFDANHPDPRTREARKKPSGFAEQAHKTTDNAQGNKVRILSEWDEITSFAEEYFKQQLKSPDVTNKISRKSIYVINGQRVQFKHSIIKALDINNESKLFALTRQHLGKGMHGTVKLALSLDRNNPVWVAAKVQKNPTSFSDSAIKKEEEIQQAVSQYVASAKRDGNYSCKTKHYNFSHYIQGPTLDKYFYKNPNLQVSEIYNVLEKAMIKLSDLHAKKIIHADINLGNILVDSNTKEPHFIDWGFAGKLDDNQYVNLPEKFKGLTPRQDHYWAPECFETAKCYKESDIYSLGWHLIKLGSRLDPSHGTCLVYLGLLMAEKNITNRLSLIEAQKKMRDFIANPNVTPAMISEMKTFHSVLEFFYYPQGLTDAKQLIFKNLQLPLDLIVSSDKGKPDIKLYKFIHLINTLTPSEKLEFIKKNKQFIQELINKHPFLEKRFEFIPEFKEIFRQTEAPRWQERYQDLHKNYKQYENSSHNQREFEKSVKFTKSQSENSEYIEECKRIVSSYIYLQSIITYLNALSNSSGDVYKQILKTIKISEHIKLEVEEPSKLATQVDDLLNLIKNLNLEEKLIFLKNNEQLVQKFIGADSSLRSKFTDITGWHNASRNPSNS